MLLPKLTVPRPKSNIIITHGSGRVDEFDCVSCVHCGKVMKIEAGSGKERGFCMSCMGPTCGKDGCEKTCTPMERTLYGI